MNNQNRAPRVGDKVRVNGGPYDGRTGFVERIKGENDVLFEQGTRPLVGLLKEDMALIKGDEDFAAPVRRLQIL